MSLVRPRTQTASAPARSLAQALPACDPMVAALSRRLYGRRMSWPAAPGEAPAAVLRWQAVRAAGAVLQVRVACEGEVFDVQWIDELPAAWPDELRHPAVPQALRRAVLTSLIEPLAAGLGLPLQLLDVQAPAQAWRAGEALGWALLPAQAPDTLEAPLRGMVRAARESGWARLAARAPMELPRAWRRDAQRLGLSLHCAAIPLTYAELRGLVPGDVLLLDAGLGSLERLSVRVRLGGHWLSRVRGVSMGHALLITQTQAPSRPDDASWDSPSSAARMSPAMTAPSSSPSASSASSSNASVAADALPVWVDVELARLSLTIDQLRGLSIGQVFELDAQASSAQVVLSCGGQRLGLAQLMVVGERLGVRVLELATPATLPASPAEPVASA